MADLLEPSEFGIDWKALHASIRRRMAYHLRGWERAEIDDAAQDVAFKLVRFLQRSGTPTHLDGLVTVIARRTAVERIRARARRSRPASPDALEAVPIDDPLRLELEELEADLEWRAFQVLEYFRVHHAPCLELAEARARGVDLKRLAAETGQSHGALLQRWSRCMSRLKAAIERGDVPWTWRSDPEEPGP